MATTGTQVDRAPIADAERERNAVVAAQAARSRIEIYSLLAGLMREPPDAALLGQLAAIGLPEPGSEHPASEPAGSAPDEPRLVSAWRQLRAAARAADPAAVDDEFHALFIGLGRGEVLPYASWYLSGALMDRSLVALRSDLARLAITRRDGNREPEDHAAALCEAMALLADPAEGVSLAEQRNFLMMHIAPWMGRFFDDVAAANGADFYRPVAALGSTFLAVEQSWLSLP